MRVQLVLAILAAGALFAQLGGGDRGHKLVSLKPNRSNVAFAYQSVPLGPIKYQAATLKRLVMDAFGVRGYQVSGGPEWVSTERWDFDARANGPKVMSMEGYRQTLLTLIEDGFHLEVHRETRVMPVYELTVSGNGPHRRDPLFDARGPLIADRAGEIRLRYISCKDLADRLTLHLDRPVIDATHTTAFFAVSLTWTPTPGEDGGAEAAGLPPGTRMPRVGGSGPPLARAIEEQLGLRLVPKQGFVPVIVVDRAERPKVR